MKVVGQKKGLIGISVAGVIFLSVGCAPQNADVVPEVPIEVAESPTNDPVAESQRPATSRFSLNQDSDINSADNRVLGGPEAFVFYDEDEPDGGDLFRSGAEAGSMVQVYTAEGPIPIGFTPLRGEKDSRGYEIAVQQEPDSDLLAITGARVRLPARGLEPETYELQVNVFGTDGVMQNTVQVAAEEASHIQALGLFGDIVIVRSVSDVRDPRTNRQLIDISAYDVSTGDRLWTNEASDAAPNSGLQLGVLSPGTLDRSPEGLLLYGALDGLTAVEVTSGDIKWVSPAPRNYLGRPEPGGTFPIRIVEYNGASAHDFRDGSMPAPDGASYAIDHEENLLVVSYVNQPLMSSNTEILGDGPAFEVIDLDDGSVIYELPREEGEKLTGLRVLSAFDGLIWVQSGPDVSVIEAATGELSPDSDNLADYAGSSPMYRGDKWLVLGNQEVPRTFLWNDSGKFSLADIIDY